MLLRVIAASLCLTALSAQTLPKYSKQRVEEMVKRMLQAPPLDRAQALGTLIGHNMISGERSLALAAQITSQSDIQSDPAAWAIALAWQGEIFRAAKRWPEATAAWREAIRLANESESPIAILNSYTVSANGHASRREIRTALEMFHQALDILRRGKHRRQRVLCLFGMAELAKSCESHVTAVTVYKEIERILLKAGKFVGAADAIIQQVEALREENRVADAQNALRRGLDHARELRDQPIWSALRLAEATLLYDLDRLDEAGALLETLLDDAPTRSKHSTASARILRGLVHLKREDYASAQTDLSFGIQALQDRQPLVWRAKFAKATLLEKTGDPKAADAVLSSIADSATHRSPSVRIDAMRARGRLARETQNLQKAADLFAQAARDAANHEVAVRRNRSEFLTAWHDLEREARARATAAERRELRDRAELAQQKIMLWWAIGVGLAGIMIALLGSRSSYRRRIAEAKRATAEHYASELEVELDARTTDLRSEMEERQELELTLQRNSNSEAIAALASGMAHDFNNLMTIVIASNDMMLIRGDGKLDEEDRRALGESTQAAQSGALITRELLEMTSNRATSPELVKVEPFLRRIRGMLERTVGEAIEIDYEIENPAASVFVREAQLTTALINLCSNARDAMNGRGVVTLRAAQGLDREVLILVKDSGQGMTPTQVAQARTPLFTTKGHGKGTGLGLSVVDRFATESQGSLFIESVLGKGTEVTLRLPSTPWEPDEGQTGGTNQEAPVQQLSNVHVLVVDDNHAVLESVARTLRQLGARVDSARDADRAQQKLLPEKLPDVVLCDVRMPGKFNGLEFAQWLSREHPKLPVVLMSGYNDHPVVDFPLLTKPFAVPDLSRAIRSASREIA